ncbi:MAG: winged helix-turn-helix domain-containing protein [Cyclobacteriaceae bacterium]
MVKEKWWGVLPGLLGLAIFIVGFVAKGENGGDLETIKVALRNAGHKVLLRDGDSVSLVLPIKNLGDNRFEIAFQNDLSIYPEVLVNDIQSSIAKAKLPSMYVVEVIDCDTHETAYSYKFIENIENSLISCEGRNLPKRCYTIVVSFIDRESLLALGSRYGIWFLVALLGMTSSVIFFKQRKKPIFKTDRNHITLGEYRFIPGQNILKKGTFEQKLTDKESDLLEILANSKNQVVERERLMKEVWEDKGVFVGRSLDVFISKLRKRLEEDAAVKIVVVHGVGYKLDASNIS